jgi:hypothetical protein
MKALKTSALILVIFLVVCFYAIFAPTAGRSLGVTMTARGFQTNTAGQVVPIYAISNRSSRGVLVVPAIERRPLPNAVVDMLGNTQQLLAAHSEILVALSNAPPERAAVHCQRERYFKDASGTARKLFRTYVLCQKEVEMVYVR